MGWEFSSLFPLKAVFYIIFNFFAYVLRLSFYSAGSGTAERNRIRYARLLENVYILLKTIFLKKFAMCASDKQIFYKFFCALRKIDKILG